MAELILMLRKQGTRPEERTPHLEPLPFRRGEEIPLRQPRVPPQQTRRLTIASPSSGERIKVRGLQLCPIDSASSVKPGRPPMVAFEIRRTPCSRAKAGRSMDLE